MRTGERWQPSIPCAGCSLFLRAQSLVLVRTCRTHTGKGPVPVSTPPRVFAGKCTYIMTCKDGKNGEPLVPLLTLIASCVEPWC
jgi:hypothetical protein